jgi:ABC-type multidrug transport system fused ATPase/permease subunit
VLYLKDNNCVYFRENLPYVLNNITFETRPAEKIGVCGRTGSGKSSLFAALFRMVDKFEGDIFIDHVNTKAISLSDLR